MRGRERVADLSHRGQRHAGAADAQNGRSCCSAWP
jgi:hypothetical protein